MEKEIITELSDIKSEMKYMSKTMNKLEKVLENYGVIIEKQNVANKRILKLEDNTNILSTKIRKLEDWKLSSITYITIFATVGSTVVGILIKKFL